MAVSAEFRTFIADQLTGLGPITIKRMFGGAGVYADGVMFTLIADDMLYFKADAGNRADFEAEGMSPFVYQGKGGRPVTLSYWRAPEWLYEDPDAMTAWAQKALAAVRRSAKR